MGRRLTRITGDEWTPQIGILSDEDALRQLSDKYKLAADDELLLLLTEVRDRHTREQGEDWSAERFIKLQDAAKRDLQHITKYAKDLEASAACMHKLIAAFAVAYEYEPNLMQAIAKVGIGDELFAAPEFQCLDAVSRLTAAQASLRTQLQQIMSLRLLPKKCGRVPPVTLQSCVDQCRRYWRSKHGACQPETLEDPATRADTRAADLDGDCERFLSDVLQMTGVQHTLAELGTAMSRRLATRNGRIQTARHVKGTKQP